jgi:hypothetical protein
VINTTYTITNQTPTGFTINWHDRARRSAVRHSSWTRTSGQNARPHVKATAAQLNLTANWW